MNRPSERRVRRRLHPRRQVYRRHFLWVLLFVCASSSCSRESRSVDSSDLAASYPVTHRSDHRDTYHGVVVPDPYRWLEADPRSSPEVRAWVQAQNALTAAVLADHPDRGIIRRRLTALWAYERQSSPISAGPVQAFFRHDGIRDHAVLYVRARAGGPARILLDPNGWAGGGKPALTGVSFSKGGDYVAFATSTDGSDWQTWRVMDVASARLLDDEIRWVKFSHPAWTADGRGFFYARYPQPAGSSSFQARNLHQKVYFHRLGTPQRDDVLVYERPDHPDWGFGVHATDDGRYLLMVTRRGDDDRYRVMYQDLSLPGATRGEHFVTLVDHFENQFYFMANDGPIFYFLTDLHAPRRRLIAIDTRTPAAEHWREILPQGPDPIADVGLVGGRFFVVRLRDATTRVDVHGMDGAFMHELRLPGIGTAAGFGGRKEDRETFYTFTGFTSPPIAYRYDIESGRSTPLHRPRLPFDPAEYETRQVTYASKDGTRIPMFISHRRGLKLDGTNPTLLYGYGGLGLSLTPWFSVSALAWMEAGGVYAVPSLRGGGEYGVEWHEAGTRLKKQNVFDDFIGAAEWLIAHRYTRPDRLVIEGGSNGGLLVAAVLVQRPDLVGAALPEVPLTDMLRYHRFTTAAQSITEYGSSDDPAEFTALLAYSPYHNVRPGVRYPPTLVTTGDTDDRVPPLHSFKFVAALQHAQAPPSQAPTALLRVEEQAGHGDRGKPVSQRIEEVTDQFTFLARSLRFEWRPSGGETSGRIE